MSEANPSVVFKRKAFAKDNGKGESVADWTLTPQGVSDPVQIIAQPICTIPIIFVPGIMGSNLKVTQDVDGLKKDEAVWLTNGKVGAASDWLGKTAQQRQLRLNPATTAVTGEGAVPSQMPTIGDAEAIQKKRYWGEVAALSYQDLLVWLEKTLNQRGRLDAWRGELGQTDYASSLAEGLSFQSLAESDLTHAAYFRYPVYAFGYNWLRSNLEAGGELAQRITKVIEANNSSSFTCQKVILVTHSMGGLVARACSELKGMQGKIAGIVHGVMPATGSPTAYKRVRAGTEGPTGAVVIGGTAEKMTAVFANSPGALQLLPNQLYGDGWLKLGTGTGRQFKEVTSLPNGDPYEQIYKQRGPWWGLVREELINPAKVDGHKGWSAYINNIDKASAFHAELKTLYHPNTYTFHGDGRDNNNGLTWGAVRWEAEAAGDLRTVTRGRLGHAEVPMTANPAEMLSMSLTVDDGQGKLSAVAGGFKGYNFVISPKDAAGDGTVPVVSGNAPASKSGVKATYHLNLDGQGHEGAYRNPAAQRVTLHSILRITQTVAVLE